MEVSRSKALQTKTLFQISEETCVHICFRLADHFGGKLHMGFIKIRDRLKELEVRAEVFKCR